MRVLVEAGVGGWDLSNGLPWGSDFMRLEFDQEFQVIEKIEPDILIVSPDNSRFRYGFKLGPGVNLIP